MVTLNPYDMDETELVARTLMGEAGQQSPEGILAAGSVMANRVNSPGFGDSFRDVIMAPGQFSLYNDITGYAGGEGANDVWRGPIPPEIMNIASNLTSGNYQDPTGGAVNYFNPQISNPGWAEGRQFTDIGDHRFLTPEGQEVMGNPAHEGFVLPKSSSPMQNFAEERAQQSFEIQKNVTARMDELARTQDDAFRLTTGLATPQEIMQEQQAATAEKNETMRQTALEALQEQLAIPKGRGSVFTGDEFDTAGLYMYPNEAARNQASLPPHMRSSLGGAAGGPIPPDPATASIGPAGGPIPPGPATASIGPAGGPVPLDPLSASIGPAGGPIPPDTLSASIGAAGGPIPPGPAAAATASIGPAGGPIPPGPLSASIGAAGGPIPSTSRGVTAPAVTSGFNDPTVDYPVAAQTGIPSPAASGNAAPQSAAEEKDPWNWKLSLFEGLEGVGVGLGQMSVGQAVNMGPTFARQEAAKLGRAQLGLDRQTEARLTGAGAAEGVGDRSMQQGVHDAFLAQHGDTPENRVIANAALSSPTIAEEMAKDLDVATFRIRTPAQQQNVVDRANAANMPGMAELASLGMEEANYVNGLIEDKEKLGNPIPDVETHAATMDSYRNLATSTPEIADQINGLVDRMNLAQAEDNTEEYNRLKGSMTGILQASTKRITDAARPIPGQDIQKAVIVAEGEDIPVSEAIQKLDPIRAGNLNPAFSKKLDRAYDRVTAESAERRQLETRLDNLDALDDLSRSEGFRSGRMKSTLLPIAGFLDDMGIKVTDDMTQSSLFAATVEGMINSYHGSGLGPMTDADADRYRDAIGGLDNSEDSVRAIQQFNRWMTHRRMDKIDGYEEWIDQTDTYGAVEGNEYVQDYIDRNDTAEKPFFSTSPDDDIDEFKAALAVAVERGDVKEGDMIIFPTGEMAPYRKSKKREE